MTREEFVRAYAKRSGLSDEWAVLGMIEAGNNRTMIALPCACDAEACEGWAMLSAGTVLDHLFFHAPEPLRSAYRESVATPALRGE